MRTKIGQLIKEEVERQGLTADQFAGLISTSRTNVYHIFNRENIDMELLVRISSALHRNFFTELYKDMSVLLGASEPPATMANYQLASLGSLISKEIDGCTYTFPEYSKDREGLKAMLKEYFESDHRKPLLILESGFTFGAKEVVKQMAREVFHGCDSAPCPKMLDVTKVKIMPERVLVDYIDKNTYDSLEESNRRLNELCQIQKEVTKKFVCIIHTDPTVSITGADEENSFDQWGSEYKMMVSRFEQCFITVYRWGRQSLLSWAVDNNLHEYVVNYIRNHHLKGNTPVDYQLSNIEVPLDQILLGLSALNEPADYPTAHTYSPKEWEFVSTFISEKRDISEEFDLREFTLDIINFNENNELEEQLDARRKKEAADAYEKKVKESGRDWYVEVEIGIEVEGNMFDSEKISLPERVVNVLRYLYHQAWETDLKGLDEYDDWEEFDKWLKQHHPELVKELTEVAEDHMIEQLDFDNDGNYRNYIPCEDLGGCWGIMPNLEYKFDLYGLPKWE